MTLNELRETLSCKELDLELTVYDGEGGFWKVVDVNVVSHASQTGEKKSYIELEIEDGEK